MINLRFQFFRIIFALTAGLVTLLFITCTSRQADEAYRQEIAQWHRQRIASLSKPDSWLSLAGLFLLHDGTNRFGADSTNDIVFPPGKAPARMGTFFLENGVVRVKIDPGVPVTSDGKPVTTLPLKSDADGKPTILEYRSLNWYIIKRGEQLFVRLKDRENPRIAAFKGIEMFPVDEAWQVEATFEPYHPAKMIDVPTVLGTIDKSPSPGALVFRIKGKTYRLDPLAEPGDKEYFVVFADATTGFETYGGGRFLSVAVPGPDGKTVIDFNKAYNPPCAFSEFATCPLPPKQNRLPIKITAGEKKYGSGHH